jgi:hypothetical protein
MNEKTLLAWLEARLARGLALDDWQRGQLEELRNRLARVTEIRAKRDADVARLAAFYCGRPVTL